MQQDCALMLQMQMSGVTATCGITEPSLYGVTLKLKKPLIASMIGGGVAGLYLGIMGVGRYVIGQPGVLDLPSYIGGEGMYNVMHAGIGMVIAFVVPFVITLAIGFNEKDFTGGQLSEELSGDSALERPSTISGIDSRECDIVTPLVGKVLNLSEVKDEAFAAGVIGKGLAVLPEKEEIYAPISGRVTLIYPTKHAIGLESDNGLEILLHLGMDTVELEGKPFEVFVNEGAQVSVGQLIGKMDIKAIEKAGLSIVTPIVVTNLSDENSITAYEIGRKVQRGEILYSIQ